jgi:hypothetical protein
VVIDMHVSPLPGIGIGKMADPTHYNKLMHLHENPKRQIGGNPPCRAALQISASSFDDLIAVSSGGARRCMLGFFCSM